MTPIEGKDVDLFVYRDIGGTPTPALTACGTSVTMEQTTELIPAATADSGPEDDYEPGFTGCTLGMENVMTIDDLSKYQFEDFIDNPRKKQRIIIIFTDSYGDKLSYDMNVLVETASAHGDVNDFAAWSLSMKRCGAMTKLKIYDHILVDPDGNPILDSNGDLIRVP